MSSLREHAAPTDFFGWRLCAWAGPVYFVCEALAWAGVAGFLPPPQESWSTAQTYQYFVDNSMRVRLGMMLTLLFAPLYYIWSIVVSKVVARVEGPDGTLATIELLGGFATVVVTFGSVCAWLAAAFDPALKSPEAVKATSDLAWMWFNPTLMVTFFQFVAFGLALLRDKRAVPLLPRWMGWFSFAMAATLLGALFTPFFRRGPFAWDGLLTYYVGLGGYFLWIGVTCFYVLKAVRRIEEETLA